MGPPIQGDPVRSSSLHCLRVGPASNYILAAALVVLAVAASTSIAQQEIPSCALKLVPCGDYLNSTKPPPSCCGPMKDAVKNELPCLCSLFNSPDLLKAFSVNLTQALQLPKHCGVSSDASVCSKSGAKPPKSSAKAPPAASEESSTKKDESGAFDKASHIGMPGLVSSTVFAWSTMMAL